MLFETGDFGLVGFFAVFVGAEEFGDAFFVFEEGEFFEFGVLFGEDFVEVSDLTFKGVVLFAEVLVGVLEFLHDFMHAVVVDLALFVLVLYFGQTGCEVGQFVGEVIFLFLRLGFEGLVGIDEFADFLEGLLVLEFSVRGVHLSA